jgi:hypothetical protein
MCKKRTRKGDLVFIIEAIFRAPVLKIFFSLGLAHPFVRLVYSFRYVLFAVQL